MMGKFFEASVSILLSEKVVTLLLLLLLLSTFPVREPRGGVAVRSPD